MQAHEKCGGHFPTSGNVSQIAARARVIAITVNQNVLSEEEEEKNKIEASGANVFRASHLNGTKVESSLLELQWMKTTW